MKYLRSAIALLGLLAGAVILSVTFLLGLLHPSGTIAWWTTRAWAWLILYTGGVEALRSRGFEKLSGLSGAVVMSNHESLLDPVVIMALSARPVRFLARHELFYIPIFGWAMWSNGHLAVKRGESSAAVVWLSKAIRTVREGELVLVYPEGSRSTVPDLLPFKKGGFLLALRSGALIVPVGVFDTMQVCPKGWHWAGRAPVAAIVGEPIDTAAYSLNQVDMLMQVVRDRILKLREQAAKMILPDSKICELL